MAKKVREYFYATSIGLSLVVAIFVGVGIGLFLDRYFGTKPYLTILFLILGIISGYKNMFYFIKKIGIFDDDN